MPKKKDLTGARFGKLVAVRTVGKKSGAFIWECMCDCGNLTVVRGFELTRGHTKSCGCLRRDLMIENNTTHGLHHTRLYTIWCGMKERCYNRNASNYSFYGGRSVAICAEWLTDFRTFYEWAISNGYKDGLTLDRKDSDGDYEPSNCQWITRSENTTRANTKRWAIAACEK